MKVKMKHNADSYVLPEHLTASFFTPRKFQWLEDELNISFWEGAVFEERAVCFRECNC